MTIDLGATAAIHDPATYFGTWLPRGEAHWSDRPRGWAVIGHDEVASAFRDAETLSADRVSVLERVAAERSEEFGLVVELLSGWMIFRDPPAHTRLREPVRAVFTPRRVTAMQALLDQIVDECFDRMIATAADGAGALTEHVTRPLPALVVGALLGVDPADRPQLQGWSDDFASIVFSMQPSATPPGPVLAAARAFHEFFGRVVDTADPDDDGLVARIRSLDTSFSRTELIGMCTMLLFAGHETTTGLLQHIAGTLLEDPALVEVLRRPGTDLDAAVEEFMRCYGPARTMVRKVARDHRRAGVDMTVGQTVLLSIAGANHDPRVFDHPGTFDPARDPNPHLGFGWGLHHCLGAQLARAEATAFLRALLGRFPELLPAGPVPPLGGSIMGFGRGPILLAV